MRLAEAYPAVSLLFKIIQTVVPSAAARRKAHLKFTKDKIEERLNRDTDRKDLMTYARFPYVFLVRF
jgi:hypothetical protein